MSESQKDIIERLLKQKRKSKRDLANFLEISENSISRTLKNPKISLDKLYKIAEFLDVDIRDLIPSEDITSLKEPEGDYHSPDYDETLRNLSEALKSAVRTIEIMAENKNNKDQ